MRKELSVVNGMQRVFAFGLDNDFTFHDEVCSKSAIKLNAVIDKGHCLLIFYFQAQLSKVVSKARLVR